MGPNKEGVVLVTGASSGIGAATVRALCAGGWRVVGVARRADRLAALADETGCEVETLDMRDFPAAEALVRRLGPTVVINNAGSGYGFEGLVNATPEQIAASVELNVMAPLQLVRAAIPIMTARGGGHIVNLGSIAGLYPIVSALYGATKGAVHLMSQNLRVELKGTGIRMTEIAPGRVTSEFYDAALEPERAAVFKASGVTELAPEDVAAAILYALEAPAHVNVGLIEMTPTEQVLGGAHMTPYAGPPPGTDGDVT